MRLVAAQSRAREWWRSHLRVTNRLHSTPQKVLPCAPPLPLSPQPPSRAPEQLNVAPQLQQARPAHAQGADLDGDAAHARVDGRLLQGAAYLVLTKGGKGVREAEQRRWRRRGRETKEIGGDGRRSRAAGRLPARVGAGTRTPAPNDRDRTPRSRRTWGRLKPGVKRPLSWSDMSPSSWQVGGTGRGVGARQVSSRAHVARSSCRSRLRKTPSHRTLTSKNT